MRVLPSGSAALLVELDDLGAVLALHAAVEADRPAGVLDVVPAGRTLLLVTEPGTDLDGLAATIRRAPEGARSAGPSARTADEVVEVPVRYDGEDLADLGRLLGCDAAEVVRRHVEEEWTVGFCGFAPGFGYLVGSRHPWDVPRREAPRTRVPAGSVALAGEFTGVYPRASPGGWQLLGTAQVEVFDADRDPPALLRPGVRVRFVEVA